MIPIFDRSHIFSFCKEPNEIRLVVEAAVIAYFRCTESGVRQQVASLCNPQVVDISDERNARLSLEEMTECGIGHIDQARRIREGYLL